MIVLKSQNLKTQILYNYTFETLIYMTAGEFVHICQFFQTIFAALVFILLGIEITTLFIYIHPKLSKDSQKTYKQQLQWYRSRTDSNLHTTNENNQNNEHNQLEKSVTNYVQNQITNMEKPLQQPKEHQKDKKIQQEDQNNDLSPRQQKLYIVYKAFHNFMNEKMAIFIPLLVIGIITQSAYIYTLAAFFFSFLCEVLIKVFQSQQTNKRALFNGSTIISYLKIVQKLFVMSIFISYWAVKQFDAS